MLTPTAYQLDTLRRQQDVGIMTVRVDGAFVSHVFDGDATRHHTTVAHATETEAFEAARAWCEKNLNDSWGVIALA